MMNFKVKLLCYGCDFVDVDLLIDFIVIGVVVLF